MTNDHETSAEDGWGLADERAIQLLGEPEQMTKEYNFQSGQQGVVAWENVRIILNGPADSKQIELVASGLVRPQQTMNGNESMVVLIESRGFRIGKETVLRFPNSQNNRHIQSIAHRLTILTQLRDVDGVSIQVFG